MQNDYTDIPSSTHILYMFRQTIQMHYFVIIIKIIVKINLRLVLGA